MKPSTYRKKPVEVQALIFVYSGDGIKALEEFCGDQLVSYGKERSINAVGWAQIGTLEDGADGQAKHIATEGDYIIRGVKGEFYPCKPDIFAQTYEMVSESKPTPVVIDWQKAYEEIMRRSNIDPIPVNPLPFFPAPVKDVRKCPKCGLELSGVMGYVCPNVRCPTGMGSGGTSWHSGME